MSGELFYRVGLLGWESRLVTLENGFLIVHASVNDSHAGGKPELQAELSRSTINKINFSKYFAFSLTAKLKYMDTKRSGLDRNGWIGLGSSQARDAERWIRACVANGAVDHRTELFIHPESQELLESHPRIDLLRDDLAGEADARLMAARMLQRLIRNVMRRRVDRCDPLTFRTGPPGNGRTLLADWGRIHFGGRASEGGVLFIESAPERPARRPLPYFIRLSDHREPSLNKHQYMNSVIDLLERHWRVGKASVVISITGGARDFDVPQRLLKAFKQGLVKAALATNALIVTGGTDSGVMQIVGKAIAEYDAHVPVIGIATYGTVLKRDRLCGSSGGVCDMTPDQKNNKDGGNLEPNHTHFLLVDTGLEGVWGGEIALRNAFEAEYCTVRRVPRVLLVVQGGPNTLSTVLYAIESECPVVLIADSGGVAELLHVFLLAYNDITSSLYHQGLIPDKFKERYKKDETLLKRIAVANEQSGRVTSFSLSQIQTAELDLHLLNAVINDRAQCKPESRLKLAVEWNRVDVVQRVLVDGGKLNQREALQCAMSNQRIDILKLLLTRDPNIVRELDLIDLYRDMLFSVRVFRNSSVDFHNRFGSESAEPIRMALLAAYASRKAAGADITEEVKIPAARSHAFSLCPSCPVGDHPSGLAG
ncbi:MAG: hypothetical protein SGPRY_000469 [Prymnesium sp.]